MRRALLVRIHRLTDLHGIEKEHFNTLADPLVDNYIKEMMHSFAQPYEYPNTLSAVHDTWTFSAAISFTAIMLVTIDKYHDKGSADSTDNEEEHRLLSDWKAMKYFDSFSSLDIMTADEYY
uniref:Uncharacterized protein n=1 Tax=Plectus sambesii TaxID=2011161 RepID=A0A914UQJ1_9BILA